MKSKNASLSCSNDDYLLKNISHSTVVQFAGLLMSLSFSAYMMRRVGGDYFGHITSANAVISICIIFSTFGWPVLLTKIFACGHRTAAIISLRKSLRDVCIITLITTAVLAVLIMLNIINKPSYHFVFLPLLIFLRSIIVLAKSILDGVGKVIVEQYAIGVLIPLLTIVCFVSVGTLDSIDSMFAIYITSTLIGVVILIAMSLALASKRLDSSHLPLPVKASHNWWLMSASLSNVVLLNTDIIIMGHYVTERTIAVYGIISGVVAVMTIGISAGNAIFAPVIVKLYQYNDYDSARKTFRFVQKQVLLWSLPFFLVLCIFPSEIIGALADSALEKNLSNCLIILAVAQLINAATGPVATSLYMEGDVSFFAISMMACVVLNIVGNLWLVPKYGAVGAALSTASVIILVNIAQYLRARQLNIV